MVAIVVIIVPHSSIPYQPKVSEVFFRVVPSFPSARLGVGMPGCSMFRLLGFEEKCSIRASCYYGSLRFGSLSAQLQAQLSVGKAQAPEKK